MGGRRPAGLIQLRWGTTIYCQVQPSLCPAARRGLRDVEARHHRRGIGRVLARAAAARRAGFSWRATRRRLPLRSVMPVRAPLMDASPVPVGDPDVESRLF
ncbi:hypothetical protein AB0M83_06750 [Amycolatopsis sp. NPDC051106]|uniref:hypothetical protein n=1 Tax=Amycolatopsis sp. NPDC051106 TaxID=3157100 RepID=UPI0034122795